MKKILVMLVIVSSLYSDNLSDGMKAIENENFSKAVEYFKKAVAEGNALAAVNLAVMYENGYGVKKNHEKVSELLNDFVVDYESL